MSVCESQGKLRTRVQKSHATTEVVQVDGHCDSEKVLEAKYWLDRSREEIKRLEEQHEFLKRILGRKLPFPPSFKIEKPISERKCNCREDKYVYSVLDVGAGSLAWTLDVAKTLDANSRLRRRKLRCSDNAHKSIDIRDEFSTSNLPSDDYCEIDLYACDLSGSQFPSQSILDEYGITAFEHDVSHPFPKELNGKFDLIHLRLLVFALSEEEWGNASRNLRLLLKPGGKLLLMELNATWYHADSPFPNGWKYVPQDLSRCNLQTRSNWVDRFNQTVEELVIRRNKFIPDLVYRLPTLLSSNGWDVITRTPFVTPMGVLCRTYPGPHGQNLEEEEELTISMTVGVYDAIMRNAIKTDSKQSSEVQVKENATVDKERLWLKDEYKENGVSSNGRLEDILAVTEERRQWFMDTMIKGLREEGALAVWVEIVASPS